MAIAPLVRPATEAARAGAAPTGALVEARGWGWRPAGRSRWAVRGLDLRIEPGERVLLLGPSGAGKSTLLAGLAGVLDTDSGTEEGTLAVHGGHPRSRREHVGLVLQDPESQIVMSRVGDDVAFGLENRGQSPTDIWPRVADALRTVGLGVPLATSTQALSGGEKQRLALAGVLALGPSLLLLDEPTANLDPDGATLVRAALRDALEATGATLLMVEHRVAEALGLVTRVVVLAAGRGVIADGPPAEVFDRSGTELARAGVWVPGHRPTSEWGPPSGTPGGASRVGEARIRARDVAYRYPGAPRQAVCGMSAELRAGETLAITGANGSGKSTFAMMLAGLMRPDAGTVEVPDDPVPLWRVPARRLVRCVGTVFQEPEHQFLTGTVADELALGPRRAGMPASRVRRRVDELLTRLRLEHLPAANPFTLSGGEKRRLSVATAMATSPPALILDEPTFGQDARTWAEMVALLSELRDEGRALAVVTHDREFVAALAGRAVRMVDGRAT